MVHPHNFYLKRKFRREQSPLLLPLRAFCHACATSETEQAKQLLLLVEDAEKGGILPRPIVSDFAPWIVRLVILSRYDAQTEVEDTSARTGQKKAFSAEIEASFLNNLILKGRFPGSTLTVTLAMHEDHFSLWFSCEEKATCCRQLVDRAAAMARLLKDKRGVEVWTVDGADIDPDQLFSLSAVKTALEHRRLY